MKIKTSELQGAPLDWAVAKCEGLDYWRTETAGKTHAPRWTTDVFCPSTDWAQGGPIIERERIKIFPTVHGKAWTAQLRHTGPHPLAAQPVITGWTNRHGPTPLIAAMRCYVAGKLGVEVEVPNELTTRV